METAIAYWWLFFIPLLLVGCDGREFGKTSTVTTCSAFRTALENVVVTKVEIKKDLRCTSTEWGAPVRIKVEKDIIGLDEQHLTVINMRELISTAILLDENGRLKIDRLAIVDGLRLTGTSLEFSFLQLNPGSSVSISRSYVVQSVCSSTNESLFFRSQYNACGTRYRCGAESINTVHGVDPEMEASCRSPKQISSPEENSTALHSSSDSINSITILLILVSVFTGLTIFSLLYNWKGRSVKDKPMLDQSDNEGCFAEDKSTDDNSSPSSARVVNFDDFTVDLDHQLGSGGFATVYAGKYHGEKVAVKVIKNEDVPEGKDACVEANLSVALNHPNVLTTYAARQIKLKDLFGQQHIHGETPPCTDWTDEETGEDICTLIIMEYCDKGELSRAIDRGEYIISFKTMQPNICAVLHSALDIANGLQYLHENSVVHGDIKPDNILRKTETMDPRGFVCKICDFGLSIQMEAPLTKVETLGMISYMPPEMLRKGRIGKFTDVYSFGMLLWEMVTSDVPYSEVDYKSILMEAVNGRRPVIPKSTPTTISNLIRSCWSTDYRKRPAAAEIVKCLNEALSEWYSSFPRTSKIPPTPNRMKSPWKSDGLSRGSVQCCQESSLQSDKCVDGSDDRSQSCLFRSFSTLDIKDFHETSSKETGLPEVESCVPLTSVGRTAK